MVCSRLTSKSNFELMLNVQGLSNDGVDACFSWLLSCAGSSFLCSIRKEGLCGMIMLTSIHRLICRNSVVVSIPSH